MTTESSIPEQVDAHPDAVNQGQISRDEQYKQGIDPETGRPVAGNAANAEKARVAAQVAGTAHSKDPRNAVSGLIADKQTGDDPHGAGPTGHGITEKDPQIETPEQPPIEDSVHAQMEKLAAGERPLRAG